MPALLDDRWSFDTGFDAFSSYSVLKGPEFQEVFTLGRAHRPVRGNGALEGRLTFPRASCFYWMCMRNLLYTRAPAAVVLVRLMVGGVFLAEGIQKFLYPAELGSGRFVRIGIPFPDLTGPFVGSAEVICGSLILLGLLTRPAALVMLFNISVAIVSTKLPILLGQPIGPFSLTKLARYGLWSALHESRTDLSMWLGSLFLVVVGAGAISIDAFLTRRRHR